MRSCRIFQTRGRYLGLSFDSAAMDVESGMRFFQCLAISKPPCGLEVVRVVGWLLRIEVDDALDRVLIAIGFDQHRIGREINAVGRQHQMVGHCREPRSDIYSAAPGDMVSDSPELSKPA